MNQSSLKIIFLRRKVRILARPENWQCRARGKPFNLVSPRGTRTEALDHFFVLFICLGKLEILLLFCFSYLILSFAIKKKVDR